MFVSRNLPAAVSSQTAWAILCRILNIWLLAVARWSNSFTSCVYCRKDNAPIEPIFSWNTGICRIAVNTLLIKDLRNRHLLLSRVIFHDPWIPYMDRGGSSSMRHSRPGSGSKAEKVFFRRRHHSTPPACSSSGLATSPQPQRLSQIWFNVLHYGSYIGKTKGSWVKSDIYMLFLINYQTINYWKLF